MCALALCEECEFYLKISWKDCLHRFDSFMHGISVKREKGVRCEINIITLILIAVLV